MMVSADVAEIIVVERNPVVASRVARVLSASASLATTCVIEDVTSLAQTSFSRARLIACSAEDWSIVAEWRGSTAPRALALLWTTDNDRALIERCAKDAKVVAVVGWPKFLSTPRLWELGQAARRALVGKSAPTLEQLLSWGAASRAWSPVESADIEAIVNEARAFAEAANAHPRVAERVGEAAYELLMNAVYDAPSLADGTPRYAMDRTAPVSLEDWERPALVCATDGVRLALQATDPFGGLQRWHVFDSVARGLSAQSSGSDGVVDSSRGGAGLGFFKMFSCAPVVIASVDRGRSTEVTLFWDLDVHPRELRGAPSSLHFWSI